MPVGLETENLNFETPAQQAKKRRPLKRGGVVVHTINGGRAGLPSQGAGTSEMVFRMRLAIW